MLIHKLEDLIALDLREVKLCALSTHKDVCLSALLIECNAEEEYQW